ncbi:MAG: alpha-L-arabinofuranosidase C-terminal domain-containing protein, partial [Prevotellaceae bacterium]|nr:alpha-L-arabinofuranosidase C-terminal domain-containing protein [Prevotellaceae bacterium]
MELMPEYVQDILDLIEWANADAATSHWAKMRAEAGHPAPFNLKYIGIGNEDLISDVFTERYLMICKAVKERYPEITVCGTVGPFHKGSSDYEWGWKIAKENANIIDMVDEHYYESPGWFMHNQDYYDNYDRNAPKVYLGEYASHPRNRGNQLEASLTEALHLCNVERNGDVVMMTSYAPLLSKDGHSNWNPDLIYFNNREVRTTKSYKVQKDFSTMSGDEYIYSILDLVGEPVERTDSPSADFKHRIATSIVRNSHTGQTYLRVVNALPVKLNIKIGDRKLTIDKYSYIVEAI